MRIAINGFFWDRPHTGSGQYLRRLWAALPGLPEAGEHEFVLLRPGAGPPDAPPAPPNTRIHTVSPGPFAGRAANLAQLWWEQIGLPGAARAVGADVLHCPYLAAPWRSPVPLIVTAHDLIPWVLPAYQGSAGVQLYLRLARAASRKARLLLADSECSRQDVLRVFGLPPERVRTVLLGIEPEFGAPVTPAAVAAMRARLGLPERYAFYIGGFDTRKNVPLLLDAWATALSHLEVPGAPLPALVIAGHLPDPGGLYPDLPAQARRLGLLGPVASPATRKMRHPTPHTFHAPLRFLGRVSETDKRLLLAGARLFAFPSFYEGFGYDPLEALAAGAPVICSNASSLPEVVGDAGLLLPPGDTQAWCEALVRVWQDPALRADLARRGRAQAARFDPATTAAATLRAYTDVMRDA
jgi:glycosyltransferase involved in cell wall biosynthesis